MDQVFKVILLILAALVVIIILILLIVLLVNLHTEKKAAGIARKKCEDYVKQICDDSNPKNKPPLKIESASIMGGTFASDGQLPHMVFYGAVSGKRKFSCGAAIISEYFVMTAAHCVHNFKNHEMYIFLGAANYSHPIIMRSGFKVDEVHTHPHFNYEDKTTIPNDIALLKLNRKIEFDWKTRPICLNHDFESISTANLTVSGWGVDEYGIHSELLQVVQTYVDGEIRNKCIKKYGKETLEVMYCAGHPTEPKGPCQGDSGGPLQIPLKNGCPNTYKQIGIVSVGSRNCTLNATETSLVLYVKVERRLVWIVGIVWPDLM